MWNAWRLVQHQLADRMGAPRGNMGFPRDQTPPRACPYPPLNHSNVGDTISGLSVSTLTPHKVRRMPGTRFA